MIPSRPIEPRSSLISWDNPDVALYHGTTLSNAQNIRRAGVDLGFALPRRDFGRGFYTTPHFKQAKKFARDQSESRRCPAGVLGIALDRDMLARLEILGFVLGNAEASDYWSLVQSCRHGLIVGHGRVAPSRGGFYDAVFGPVARNFNQRTLHAGFDQISFHTEIAVSLLNTDRQERMILAWTS